MEIKQVAQSLLSNSESLLNEWFPNGKLIGREYTLGDLSGAPGESLKINVDSGKWADFSTGEKGGDLVSLYAAMKKIKQIEAAKELSGVEYSKPSSAGHSKPAPLEYNLVKPPVDKRPPTADRELGEASNVYTYLDQNSEPIFYVVRYDLQDGKKEFRPYSFTDLGKWTRRAPKDPRPLYGLNRLKDKKYVLIVEGEKAADAAHGFTSGHYAVVSWPNGVNSVDKVDWSPVYGKQILIWPDHDEAGRKAASLIAKKLLNECPEVKVINTKTLNLPDGWDAADSNFTWDEFKAWAKPITKQIEKPITPEIVEPVPPTKPAHVVQNTTNILVTKDFAKTKISANEASNISRCGLQKSKNGIPAENFLNVSKVIKHDFKSRFWFDEFYRSFMTDIDGKPEILSDNHIFQVLTLVQSSYGMRKISKSIVTDGICSACYADRRHAARDWIKGLTWDGVARVETFFLDHCGAEGTNVNREISKYFFTSFAARLLGPELDPASGNKVDAMIILEGVQGIGKGMLLKAIVGPAWHYEISRSLSDKDFYQDMRGKLLAEFADFSQFETNKVNQIKQLITCQTDRMRVSYGRESQDFDRVCIFVATTNEKEYLFDATGNRRFLPIKLGGKINLDAVRKIREQLFAEAVVLYKSNIENWWRFKHWDELTKVRDDRMVGDVSDDWLPIIQDHLVGRDKIQITEIWERSLKQDIGKLTKQNRNIIAKALRSLKWESKMVREGQCTYRAWCRPIELNPLPPQPKKPIHNYAQDLC
jgi:predicted P-loop ATPase